MAATGPESFARCQQGALVSIVAEGRSANAIAEPEVGSPVGVGVGVRF